METKFNVGCGRSASIVKENCYVTITFSNDHKEMSTIDLSKHPELIIKALYEAKKQYPDFEPKCLLYQSSDWVMYYFERVL